MEGGALRGRRGISEGETGKDGKDGEDIDRGAAPILGGADAGVRGGVVESTIGGVAGGGSEGRGEEFGKEAARERGVGGARQAGAPGAGGRRKMSKSGGADSVRENPSLDGEAEHTMRTAPMQGTQNCPPRPEPTVEFINNRHSGGGMGMSKSGGAKTSGKVTAGQSGAAAAQREAAELSQGGKRTREANQKDTRRGRKGARGASSEP